MLLSETYSIRDALFYDVSSNSGVSNYTTYSDATISYDSNNQAYSITENVYADKTGYIFLNNANFPNAVKLSFKMKFTNPSNAQFGLGLANGNQSVSFIPVYSSKWGAYGTYQFIQTLDGSTRTDISVSGTFPSSSDYNTIEWYTLELTIDGTDYHSKLYRENTLIGETTGTIPNNILSADRNQFVIHTGIWNYPSVLIKDIMIEPL